MKEPITFFVPGLPATAGSKRAFAHAATGKIMVTDSCKRGKPWRASVQAFAMQAGVVPSLSPLALTVIFYMPRPQHHYTGNDRSKPLKEKALPYPITRPDATKMLRAVEDALNGIAWHDDSQIVTQTVHKKYATADDPIGAKVRIEQMKEGTI